MQDIINQASNNDEYTRRATFIVACLVSQDVIQLNIKDPDLLNSRLEAESLSVAIRVVAGCLRMYPDPGDCFELPFEW